MKRLVSKFKRSVRTRESVPNQKDSCDSGLESLPPEVRRHLLSTLDLPRLKAVVRASPTFYQQYLFNRNYLLCACLKNTLNSVATCAYAVYLWETQDSDTRQSRVLKLNSTTNPRQFLPLVGNLTHDETSKIVFFYFQLVKPLMEHYARWALNNMAKYARKDTDSHAALSSTEELRLTRAIYHFQLLCQLANSSNADLPTRREIAQAFLDLLEPWEIEELFSFYQFVLRGYDITLGNVRWDLCPDNPKFNNQDRPPTPEGAFDLGNSFQRDNYLEGLTLHGLPLLHTVLFRIKDHGHLVSVIEQHMISSYIPFNTLEGVLGDTQQALRRENHPSKRDQMQADRVPFPFCGDRLDAPPLAWTLIWDNTYSNLYGWFIPDEMRRWGYVFWDAARLEGAGGMEVLKHQWADHWFVDPRDRLR